MGLKKVKTKPVNIEWHYGIVSYGVMKYGVMNLALYFINMQLIQDGHLHEAKTGYVTRIIQFLLSSNKLHEVFMFFFLKSFLIYKHFRILVGSHNYG